MQSPVDVTNKVPSEKKASHLKFAWDRFKEIGVVPSTAIGKSANTAVSSRAADPLHSRHQEYQDLVTKRGQGTYSLAQAPRAEVPAKLERPQLTGRLLTQGLHESSPHRVEDLCRPAAFSVAILLGA